ncbi:MAG: hypothetical protein HAW61_04815 [Candidatus Portiera sp.]|nr:hypothetical protein [Portiera sp.]
MIDFKYPRQLLLDLNLGYSQTFENFIVGGNSTLCSVLKKMHPFEYGYDYSVCCWSPASSGKSHLMRAYCAYWQEQGVMVNYLSGGNLLLDNLKLDSNQLSVIVFDDIHIYLGDKQKEEELLYLLINCYERDIPFVCSSNSHPSKMSFALDDLATRFSAFYSFKLEHLQDMELHNFIQTEGHRLGLTLGKEQIDIIIDKHPTDMHTIVSLMKELSQQINQGELITGQDIERASAILCH